MLCQDKCFFFFFLFRFPFNNAIFFLIPHIIIVLDIEPQWCIVFWPVLIEHIFLKFPLEFPWQSGRGIRISRELDHITNIETGINEGPISHSNQYNEYKKLTIILCLIVLVLIILCFLHLLCGLGSLHLGGPERGFLLGRRVLHLRDLGPARELLLNRRRRGRTVVLSGVLVAVADINILKFPEK